MQLHPGQQVHLGRGLLALPFVFLSPLLVAVVLGVRLCLAPTDDVSQALDGSGWVGHRRGALLLGARRRPQPPGHDGDGPERTFVPAVISTQ